MSFQLIFRWAWWTIFMDVICVSPLKCKNIRKMRKICHIARVNVRNLIGNLIQMFWCQYREFLSQSQQGNFLNSLFIESKMLLWLEREHVLSVDFQVGLVNQPFWLFSWYLHCSPILSYCAHWRPLNQLDCKYFGSYVINIKMENILRRFSCISFLFKLPWLYQVASSSI